MQAWYVNQDNYKEVLKSTVLAVVWGMDCKEWDVIQSALAVQRQVSVSLGVEASPVYKVSEFWASPGYAETQVCVCGRMGADERLSTLPHLSHEGSELTLSVEMGTPRPDLGFV